MIQPITAGILRGQEIDFHLIDTDGNETLPLYPIPEMRKTRMVVDYEENKVMFKDNPRVWHELPTTGGERGLMLIPLTEEAVERYTPKNRNNSRSCSVSNKQKRRAQRGTTIFVRQ